MADQDYEYYEEEYEYYEEDDYNHPPTANIHDTHVPQPPAVPMEVMNDIKKKELGTSEDYINKQLLRAMEGLNIPQNARPAMFDLPKANKLTIIQQYNRKCNPSLDDNKKQNKNKPRSSSPNLTAAPLMPLMGKTISAPKLIGDNPTTQNTISLSEAKEKLKSGSSPNKGSLHTLRRHKKSKSQNSLLPTFNNNNNNKNNLTPSNQRRSLPAASLSYNNLPPPVPQAIKQKYASKSGTDSNRTSLQSQNSDTSASSNVASGAIANININAGDDDYEYYDEEYEEPQSPQKKPIQKLQYPPKPKPKSKSKSTSKPTKSVKVKLRIGSEVEVYSNSKNKWIDGNIIKIKGKLICVAYGSDNSTQKWLEATSKNFRPKIQGVKKANPIKLPSMDPSVTSNPYVDEAKVESPGTVALKDSYNNPTPERVRQSVAFQQKKHVKVKLKIGSEVEVFSVSKNQWVDGKLTGIKKNLIRIAYGKGFTTEKWLRSTSKQFRPKLDYVDAAVHKDKHKDKKSQRSTLPPKHQKRAVNIPLNGRSSADVINHGINPGLYGGVGGNGGYHHHGGYDVIDEHHEQDDGAYIPQQHQQMVNYNGIQYAPVAGIGSGAYITHSVRREQYQQYSVDTVQGVNTKRGDLKIKVHGALQLKHNGNFCGVTVAEHTLKTKKVTTDENPVWKEILTFSNFRPSMGKTGVIKVCNKSLVGEKVIGSAEFELPIVFERQEKMTIDISDSKNKLSGIVVLEQVVVEPGR